MDNNAIVYALSANKKMAIDIVKQLGLKMGESEVIHFADGETIVENNTTVRGKNVYVIQSTCPPVTERLFELLIFIDGLRRASAKEINVIIPYFGYARQDRKVRPREPITARLVADMLQNVGANHIIVTDLHTPQIQGFFTCPIDDLSAIPLFAEYFSSIVKKDDLVVVSPDHGGVTRARKFAGYFNQAGIAIIDKRRPSANVAEVMNIIGDVKGKTAIIIDDIVDTAQTLTLAAGELKKAGAIKVFAAISHPILSNAACRLIEESALEKVIVTDSIPLAQEKCTPKIVVLSIAQMIAHAIELIENQGSLGTVYSIFKRPQNDD